MTADIPLGKKRDPMPAGPSLDAVCKTYLTRLRDQKKQPNSTEELSYREPLGAFLRESAEAVGKNVAFTHEAKKLEVGRPDYEVRDGLTVIGYVEAEALNADLNALKDHAKTQNERFRQNLHCFLLTNHLDWQLWIDNKPVETVRFAEPPAQGNVSVGKGAVEDWERLIGRFLNESVPQAHSAEDVAKQLAKRAKELRFAADALLSQSDSPLEPFYNAYEKTLFANLPKEKFADVYAQTFTYGLFLAWLSHDKGAFTADLALKEIPQTVPPIKVLLDFGGGSHLPDEFRWIVDGLCSDLNNADREAALKPFADGRDPIMHFYETFLAAYDPQTRESRGVYYTPDSVVEFIVRAVDDLLQSDFDKPDGLADRTVTLLDPAVGTATFLAHAYRHVHQTMMDRDEAGQWPARAEEHVARHFFGFELLPAAYTLAHAKLRSLLMELKAPLPEKVRLPVYLTNTLDEGIAADVSLPFLDVLSKEATQAKKIKNQDDILVVLGNPPYSGHSANPSKNEKGEKTHIGKLLAPYFLVDGQPLGERNPKWLQDDYVKFLRFAEDRIEKTGQGIVAFITNHGYLDNPTFRGMRRHLMTTFDRLYFYDLHGNSLKKERAPGGGEDKNVFDIQQGVAICVLVKLPPRTAQSAAQEAPPAPNNGAAGTAPPSLAPPLLGAGGAILKHADLFGPRLDKYATLQAQDIKTAPWTDLHPTGPNYFFVPQDQDVREEYEKCWSITDISPVNVLGFQTHRDHFAIELDEDVLRERITALRDTKLTDEEIKQRFGITDNNDWLISSVRAKVRADNNWEAAFTDCLYRPFDVRHCYYSEVIIDRPRKELIRNVLQRNNLCLGVGRQGMAVNEPVWTLVSISKLPVDANIFRRGGINIFPLYIYPTEQEKAFGIEKHTNLAPAFVKDLTKRMGEEATPEEIFGYIYGVLHAPTYRTRYGEFLKRGFPRIPLPPNIAAFKDMAGLGNQLVALHLLESAALDKTGIGFPDAGTNTVDKMKADKRFSAGRVRLNDTQGFTNIPADVWEFRVGGYQPAAKWLDDRTGRTLTDADITHYRKMLAALRETLALLPVIDGVFAHVLAGG